MTVSAKARHALPGFSLDMLAEHAARSMAEKSAAVVVLIQPKSVPSLAGMAAKIRFNR